MMMAMWVGLFWAGSALADAGEPPIVEAIISADGVYRLTLRPAQPWEAAEVTVAGAHTEDLGPARGGESITLEGQMSKPGTMWLNISAALDGQRGVNWVFAIEPEVVPVRPPSMRRLRRRPLKRSLFWWKNKSNLER